MKITTIGRASIGGTLARLWTSAGHEVTLLGRGGGDVGDADVVLLALPYDAVGDALSSITGLGGQVVIDATNRLRGETPPAGHASNAALVQADHDGPVAKAFNLNFGTLFEQAADTSQRPNVIWTGDEGARAAVEQLSRDLGMVPLHGGPLENAAIQEAFATMLMAMVKDVGEGLLFYRFAAPQSF